MDPNNLVFSSQRAPSSGSKKFFEFGHDDVFDIGGLFTRYLVPFTVSNVVLDARLVD